MSANSDGGAGGITPVNPFGVSPTDEYTILPNGDRDDINGSMTNQSSITNGTVPRYTLLEQAIFGSWLSISMILAIFGNLMVIAVVWRHRGMRTRTNMFLVNLAIADFLVGILLAPFSVATLVSQEWLLGDFLCTVNSFLVAACFITSIHTLMYISIHKYLSITRPLTRMTKCKILVMIVAAWSWGILCAMLTTVILNTAEYKPGTMQCGPKYPDVTTVKSIFFHFIIQFSNIFLPLGIMMFAYARMFKEIKEHMQRLDENTALDREQIYNQQRRVTVTLFIVLACFVLCWIPYCVYANYVTFKEDKKHFPPYLNAIAYCFGYMNSACNPIIYAWRSPSFREGYKEILCQEPSYVVSDDTMHDSSPNPLRRFSTFIGSVRGSRHNSRRGSEESVVNQSGVRGHYVKQMSTASTYKLLHKLTGRTKSGSSVIRRDGSVILVKNGKIISMKLDTKLKKQDSMVDDVFISSPTTPGSKVTKNDFSKPPDLSVLHEKSLDSEDDNHCSSNSKLLRNGEVTICRSISDSADDDTLPGANDNKCNGSLVDLPDDSHNSHGSCYNNGYTDYCSDKPGTNDKQFANQSQEVQVEINVSNHTVPDMHDFCAPSSDKCNSFMASERGHVKQKSDTCLVVPCNDRSIHKNNAQSVPPATNGHIRETSPTKRPSDIRGRAYTRSSDDIHTVPLLRTPSSECESLHRSSSMSEGSPSPNDSMAQYTRRWTSSKDGFNSKSRDNSKFPKKQDGIT